MKTSLIILTLVFTQLSNVYANEDIIKALKSGNWSNLSIRPYFLFSDHSVTTPHIGVRPPSSLGPKDRYAVYEYRMANTKGRKLPSDVVVREEVSRMVKREEIKPLFTTIVKALRYPKSTQKIEIPIQALRIEFTGGNSHKCRVIDCFPPTEKELREVMTIIYKFSKDLNQIK